MRPCSSAAFGISSNRTSIAEHRPGLPRLVARPPRPSPLCCPQRLLASMRRSSSPLVSEEWGRERERIGWDHRTRAAHRTGAAPPWAGTDDAAPGRSRRAAAGCATGRRSTGCARGSCAIWWPARSPCRRWAAQTIRGAWPATWRRVQREPCTAHRGDAWWIATPTLLRYHNMRKLVGIIRQRMQQPTQRRRRQDAGLYPYTRSV